MRKWLLTLFILIFSISCFAQEKTLTVILDWFVNPNHAPLFVAQQQGFFEKQGLKVNFITPADPSDPPKLVAAGKADIGIDYQPGLLVQQAQGLPLMQIGTLINQPLTALCVLENSDIKNLSDLKGRKLAYSVGLLGEPTLDQMLKAANLNPNQVELVDVKYALLPALLSNKVDAAIGVMRNFEPIEAKLAGKPLRCFYAEDYGFPKYAELILVANTNYVDKKTLQAFLMAVQQGAEYLKQHPEDSWKIFVKKHPELNNELNRQAWFQTIHYFTTSPAYYDQRQCLKLAAFLRIQTRINVKDDFCLRNTEKK